MTIEQQRAVIYLLKMARFNRLVKQGYTATEAMNEVGL